jgi:hypothetical protein
MELNGQFITFFPLRCLCHAFLDSPPNNGRSQEHEYSEGNLQRQPVEREYSRLTIEIYSNPSVDGNVRGHDQARKNDSGKGKGEEKEDRQGIEKSQNRPIKVDGEGDKIVSQPPVGKDIQDVVSGPEGKAEDVNGENEPDRVELFYPQIKKGMIKHGPAPYRKKCGMVIDFHPTYSAFRIPHSMGS